MIEEDGQLIEEYLFIDRCAEGLPLIERQKNEKLIGRIIDRGSHAEVFIEHRINGQTTKATNTVDVSWIKFITSEEINEL